MSRRTRHLVVLFVAVVTASIASFGVYKAMLRIPARQAVRVPQYVVVAARSMAFGTSLTEQDVKLVAWPAESPVPGAIAQVKDVVNRGLLAAVLQNEPITSGKLAAAQAGAGLPPAIPPGMRAIAVKVNDVIGVAGFVVPGSRVDVVVTMKRGEGGWSKTVASNVQVLMAGTRQDQEKTASETKAKDSTVVTLMVTPKDAETIALAQSEGQIVLSLRNPLDTEPTATTGVRADALGGLSEAPVAAAPAPKPAARRVVAPPPAPVAAEPPSSQKYTVEAIRAQKRTDEVIQSIPAAKRPDEVIR